MMQVLVKSDKAFFRLNNEKHGSSAVFGINLGFPVHSKEIESLTG